MNVNLDDFLKYVLKKWKIVVFFVVAFIMLMVSSVYFIGEKIEIPPSEKYLQLKQEEASFEEYGKESLLMKMDAANIFETTIYVSNISDREQLQDYVLTAGFWDEESGISEAKYLGELLLFEDGTKLDSAKIQVWHYEAGKSQKLGEYIVKQLEMVDSTLEFYLGKEHAIMNSIVATDQEWLRNRLQAIKGQLEYTQAGCVIEVRPIIAAITGVVFGGLFSITVLFVLFLCCEKKKNVEV